MPTANHTYLCKCPIHPDGHNVRKAIRTIHNLEIENHKSKEAVHTLFVYQYTYLTAELGQGSKQ